MLSLKRGDKIFLVGIGGAGMTALAYFLKSAGYSVFGSDKGFKKGRLRNCLSHNGRTGG